MERRYVVRPGHWGNWAVWDQLERRVVARRGDKDLAQAVADAMNDGRW